MSPENSVTAVPGRTGGIMSTFLKKMFSKLYHLPNLQHASSQTPKNVIKTHNFSHLHLKLP
jgi:hypothetical protein